MPIRSLAVTLVAVLAVAGCAAYQTAGSSITSTTPSVQASAAATPSTSPPPAPVADVTLTCSTPGSSTEQTFTIEVFADRLSDFSPAWAAKLFLCTAVRNGTALTRLEETAFTTSQYANRDELDVLYELCGEVEDQDTYADPGFTPGTEQIFEINAALILCPNHPHAPAWRTAIQRGKKPAEQRAAGQRFGPGTFLVGKEIRPGKYFVEGDVSGCYWERQNKSGGTIANDYIPEARRVEVTIKSSDYAFHSEGCGEWAPIG
jgi:hypothetical protein